MNWKGGYKEGRGVDDGKMLREAWEDEVTKKEMKRWWDDSGSEMPNDTKRGFPPRRGLISLFIARSPGF
jgi:hypothetical protein